MTTNDRRRARPAIVFVSIVLAVVGAGCSGCPRYDPAAAKARFDGRVGEVIIDNRTRDPIDVVLYHPDGDGSPELRQRVAPGTVSLGGGFGSDWGIAAGGTCAKTLADRGQWDGERFVVSVPSP